MGCWNTPPAPPPDRHGARARPARAAGATHPCGGRRRCGRRFHFNFAVFIPPLFSQFRFSLRQRENSAGRGRRGREGQGRDAIRRYGSASSRAAHHSSHSIRPAAGSYRTAPRPRLRELRDARHDAGLRCRRLSRRSECRPDRPRESSKSCWSMATVSGPMPPAVAAYSVSGRQRSIAARLSASIAPSHTATRGRKPEPPGRRNSRVIALRNSE